jgi:hypothetical protein
VNRLLLICVALAAGLTGCSGGGPTQAETSACAPFLHLKLPTPRSGTGFLIIVPTEGVTKLLNSGDPRLVQDAKKVETFETNDPRKIKSLQSSEVEPTTRDIVSECRHLLGS